MITYHTPYQPIVSALVPKREPLPIPVMNAIESSVYAVTIAEGGRLLLHITLDV